MYRCPETGFDLLQSLDSVPAVIFTTAYDEYALRAFDVSAVDYLVKPIDPQRLARAVERVLAVAASARDREATPPTAPGDGRDASAPRRRLSLHDRVFVTDGDRFWLVPLAGGFSMDLLLGGGGVGTTSSDDDRDWTRSSCSSRRRRWTSSSHRWRALASGRRIASLVTRMSSASATRASVV